MITKKRGISIRFKLAGYFCALFVMLIVLSESIRFFGLPSLRLEGEQASLRKEAFRSFSLIADLQKERLLQWVEECKKLTRVLSQSVMVGKLLSEIDSRQPNLNLENTGEGVIPPAAVSQLYKELTADLLKRKKYYEMFSDLLIVDNKTKLVVASTNPDDIGKKGLAEDLAQETVTADGFYIFMSRGISVSTQQYLAFVLPIHLTENKVGQVEEEKYYIVCAVDIKSYLKSFVSAEVGLGKTGEIVLVDQDRKVLVPLKKPLASSQQTIAAGDELHSEPATRAARGEEGLLVSKDYSGTPVLAAYRHIQISPEVGWGMVVKRDTAEVFDFLRLSKNMAIVISLICVLFSFGVIILLVGKITEPLYEMAQVARRVEADDFSARVSVKSNDEIGSLAAAINKMIEKIEGWKTELAAQIQNRTAEVRAANQQLQASEQELLVANQQLMSYAQKMQDEIESRKKSEEEARKHLEELQIFYKASVGREEKILELKKRIKEFEDRT